jgi:hypothetical protein
VGSLLVAKCACGYQSGAVPAGSGFEPAHSYLPGLCRHCREVVSVAVGRPRLKCSQCGRKPAVFHRFDPEASDESFDDRITFECPSCGPETLRLEMMGIWD